jgi:hypothetical protein
MMAAATTESAPRGLVWKRGGSHIHWAELGDGRRAWAHRDSGRWVATIVRGGETIRSCNAPTLERAKAWAEGVAR